MRERFFFSISPSYYHSGITDKVVNGEIQHSDLILMNKRCGNSNPNVVKVTDYMQILSISNVIDHGFVSVLIIALNNPYMSSVQVNFFFLVAS